MIKLNEILHRAFKEWLNKLVDVKKTYRHNLTGEDNAYVFYAEFDGQRKKRVMVKVIGE